MILTPADLGSEGQSADATTVEALVAGANAQAVRVAPCLTGNTDDAVLAEARMVLIGAVKRWLQAGSGAVTQVGAGPFQMSTDTRSGRSGYSLWPSEIATLRVLCGGGAGDEDAAFMIDMTPAGTTDGIENYPAYWFQWVHPTPPNAP